MKVPRAIRLLKRRANFLRAEVAQDRGNDYIVGEIRAIEALVHHVTHCHGSVDHPEVPELLPRAHQATD